VLGQPDHHGVGGLPARRRDQLELQSAQLEGVAVVEGNGGLGLGLGRDGAVDVLVDVLEDLLDGTGERKGTARGAEGLEPGVVGLVGRIACLGDDIGALLLE